MASALSIDEWTCPKCAFVNPSSSTGPAFFVGMRVEAANKDLAVGEAKVAFMNGKRRYHAGTITGNTGEATFEIKFDDGTESVLPSELLRFPTSCQRLVGRRQSLDTSETKSVSGEPIYCGEPQPKEDFMPTNVSERSRRMIKV